MRARDNPFAVDHLHGLRFRGPSVEAVWTRARSLGGRGALVGGEGSGKTTLLLELETHLRELGHRVIWIQLRRDARGQVARETGLTPAHRMELAAIGDRDAVFVDGADLLPRRDRGWLVRRTRAAAALLGTLHAPGWLPTLAQLATSPDLLDELVRELSGRSLVELGIDHVALYTHHRGNLRAALREMYDRLAAS